jgi:hypothetical protein
MPVSGFHDELKNIDKRFLAVIFYSAPVNLSPWKVF